MSRSRSPFLAAGLLAVSLSTLSIAGCIKETDDVTVKEDGSGAYKESQTIDLSALKGLEDAGKAMEPAAMAGEKPAEKPKENPFEKLKKRLKGIDGLDVTKAESEDKDGKLSSIVEATFKTLEVYARASDIEMSCELKKNEDGSYTLKFSDPEEAAPPAEPAMGEGAGMDGAGMDAAGMDGAGKGGDDFAAAMMPALEPFLKDLEIVRKLTLPGTIVETNGKKDEAGSTVTWTVKFADIKTTGKMPAQSVTFKGDGLEVKPFSIKRQHEGMGGEAGGAGPK